MKAEFSTEQKDIIIKQFDNKDYIYICLNGEKKEKYDEALDSSMTVYEYDYNEIIEDTGIIHLDDVKNNPSKYLNYKRQTLAEKVEEQENEIQLLTNCILEMSAQIYK